jgi:hypothetical protein
MLILAAILYISAHGQQDLQTKDKRYIEEIKSFIDIPGPWDHLSPKDMMYEKKSAIDRIDEDDRDEYILGMLLSNPNSCYYYPKENFAEGIYMQRLDMIMPITEEFASVVTPSVLQIIEEQNSIARVEYIESGIIDRDNRLIYNMQYYLAREDGLEGVQRQVFLVFKGGYCTYHFVFKGSKHADWYNIVNSLEPQR